MSDPMASDLETRLDAWLASRVPADVPAALVSRVNAIPWSTGTERRMRWSLRGRHRTRSFRLVLVAVIMATLLATLAGGALLSGSLVERDATPSVAPPIPSPIPSPVSDQGFRSGGILPASIPDAIPHGVVATPLGRARWVHLSGDTAVLPDPLVPSVGPDGTLVWFASGGPGVACYNAPTSVALGCTNPPHARLWVSTDALAPRVERRLPVDAAQADLWVVGDRYWFVQPGPLSAWWSTDLETWKPTDLSGLRSPGPSSLAWTTAIQGAPVTVGATTVATVTYTVSDPGSLLGYPGRRVNLAKGESGGYVAREWRMRNAGGDVDLEPITVAPMSDGIRFKNAAGREVGRVAGVGPEFAESWVRRGEIAYDQLAVLEGDRWTPVDLPGRPHAVSSLLVDLNGSFGLFLVDADEHVRAWRTDDGRTWTGGQVAVAGNGTPLQASGGITYRDGADGQTMVAFGPEGSRGWVSSDAVTWVADPVDPGALPPVRIPAGWVRTPAETRDGTWQVSRDGTAWETVPELASIVDKAGAGGETPLGNTIFLTVNEYFGPGRDLWIIEFEAGG